MPTAIFDAFKSELSTLKRLLAEISTKTVRDELLRERFRTLYRTWVSTVKPSIETSLRSKRDFLKLGAELELVAKLTSKIKPVVHYLKRLNRIITLANGLILYLPPSDVSNFLPQVSKNELFVDGIPDLPLYLVPNALIGWQREISEFVKIYPFDKSVFIMVGYHKRNADLIKHLKKTLSDNGLNAIIASDHKLTDDLYNPTACLFCCSRGIGIFDKGGANQIFNPNVAYELGMMHLLGRECVILKHKKLRYLHTDIIMKLFLEYGTVKEAILQIKNWINP